METSLVQIVTLNRHHFPKRPFDAVQDSDLDLDLDINRINRTHRKHGFQIDDHD